MINIYNQTTMKETSIKTMLYINTLNAQIATLQQQNAQLKSIVATQQNELIIRKQQNQNLLADNKKLEDQKAELVFHYQTLLKQVQEKNQFPVYTHSTQLVQLRNNTEIDEKQTEMPEKVLKNNQNKSSNENDPVESYSLKNSLIYGYLLKKKLSTKANEDQVQFDKVNPTSLHFINKTPEKKLSTLKQIRAQSELTKSTIYEMMRKTTRLTLPSNLKKKQNYFQRRSTGTSRQSKS